MIKALKEMIFNALLKMFNNVSLREYIMFNNLIKGVYYV